VSGDVLVSLLETVVLLDVVKVITTNDDGVLHLVGLDLSLEDTATDGHVSGEGALLVNIVSVDGLLGGLDSETNVAEVTALLASYGLLVGQEDSGLLLEGSLVLKNEEKRKEGRGKKKVNLKRNR